MGVWFTQFGGQANGSVPANTSFPYATPSTGVIDTTTFGYPVYKESHSGNQENPLIFLATGTHADMEIVARFQTTNALSTDSSNYQNDLLLRGSGTVTSRNVYTYNYWKGLFNDVEGYAANAALANQNGTGTGYSFGFSSNQWMWGRFRITGNVLQFKSWLDGNAEPGSWQGTITDSRITGSGWAGIGSWEGTGTRYWSHVGIAWDGDTAPTSMPSTNLGTVNATDAAGDSSMTVSGVIPPQGSATMSSDSSLSAIGSVYQETHTTPGTITQVDDTPGNGDADWTSPTNVSAEDGAVAGAPIVNGGQSTKSLQLTNWGFSIAPTSRITGVKVETKTSGTSYMDYYGRTKLIVGGVLAGRDHSYTYPGSGTLAWYVRGYDHDTWGLNLLPSQVNASNFGYNLKLQNQSGGSTASVDSVRMRVYYDLPPLYSIAQQYVASSINDYGNSSVDKAQAIQEITNNTTSAIPLKGVRLKWSAVYTSIGGDKEGTPTVYDRTGTPWTVRMYSTQADALAYNTNYLGQWTGTLTSTQLYDQDFILSSTYNMPTSGKIWLSVVATGVAGVGEPGFVYIQSDSGSPDPNQVVYTTPSSTSAASWTTSTYDWDYQLFSAELPTTINDGGDSTLTAVGNVGYNSNSASLSSDSTLTVAGQRIVLGDASLSADSSITTIGNAGYYSFINYDADSSVTVVGSLQFYGDAELDGNSNLPDVNAQRTAVSGASISGDSSFNVDVTGIEITHLTITKTYLYKIYDKNWNYLGIWGDVVSEFGYSQEINSAGSSITVTLARNSDSLVPNYDSIGNDANDPVITDGSDQIAAEVSTVNAIGPGTTVDLDLNVKIYEFSTGPQAVEGDLVFTGYISMYTSRYGSTETTDVSLFSYGADLDQWPLVDAAGNTRVSYLSVDPSYMLRDSLDKFQAAGGLIGYDATTIEDTGTIASYTFNVNTELEVIKKSLELAPTDWYFYTDLATNLLHFHPRPTTPDHYFYLGRHILSLDLEKTIEGIVNDVIFTGGTPSNISLDRFNGVAGTNLSAHTGEISAPWVKNPASTTGHSVVVTDANRIRGNAAVEGVYFVNTIIPSNNVIVSADFVVKSLTGNQGIIARASSTALTHYLAKFDSSTNAVQLHKCINGTYTQLGTTYTMTDKPIAVGQTRHLELKCEGTRITVSVDGQTYIDLDDSSVLTGSYAGVRLISADTNTTGLHIDNFQSELIDNSNQPTIFKRYIDPASITSFRRGLLRMSDNRVTLEDSADLIVASELNRNNSPRYRSTITIANSTYDIRSIRLGELIGFRNFGNFVDDVTMQVVRIDYTPDSVTLQLDTLLPSVPKRLEDLKRNLNQAEVSDNPDAPTT